MVCQFCRYLPDNNYCPISETYLSRRFAVCASYKEEKNERRNEKATETKSGQERPPELKRPASL
jgi:hypothetical protein